MKLVLTGIIALFISGAVIGQENSEQKKRLSLTEKMMLKIMFKSVKQPALIYPFDSYKEKNEMMIGLSSSKYEDMGVVVFATMQMEDTDFSIKKGDEIDPSTYTYGKIQHVSGATIETLEGQSKDESLKMKEYTLNYNDATFVIIFKANSKDFEIGLDAANQIAKKVERK